MTEFNSSHSQLMIKLYLSKDDIRRFQLPREVSFARIKELVFQYYKEKERNDQNGESSNQQNSEVDEDELCVQYLDDEGEWVSLNTEEEWYVAKSILADQNTIKLRLADFWQQSYHNLKKQRQYFMNNLNKEKRELKKIGDKLYSDFNNELSKISSSNEFKQFEKSITEFAETLIDSITPFHAWGHSSPRHQPQTSQQMPQNHLEQETDQQQEQLQTELLEQTQGMTEKLNEETSTEKQIEEQNQVTQENSGDFKEPYSKLFHDSYQENYFEEEEQQDEKDISTTSTDDDDFVFVDDRKGTTQEDKEQTQKEPEETPEQNVPQEEEEEQQQEQQQEEEQQQQQHTPETKYSEQLQILKEIGFPDTERNLRILEKNKGNLQYTLNEILESQ